MSEEEKRIWVRVEVPQKLLDIPYNEKLIKGAFRSLEHLLEFTGFSPHIEFAEWEEEERKRKTQAWETTAALVEDVLARCKAPKEGMSEEECRRLCYHASICPQVKSDPDE